MSARGIVPAAAAAASLALAPMHARADTPAEPPARVQFSSKLTGLATYRRVYDVGMIAGEVDAAVGLTIGGGGRRPKAVYFEAGFYSGETDGGLTVRGTQWSVPLEIPIGPLRAMIAPTLGTVSITRATTGAPMSATTLGLAGGLSLDLVSSHDHAVGLLARLAGSETLSLAGSAPFVWGPSAGLFVRY